MKITKLMTILDACNRILMKNNFNCPFLNGESMDRRVICFEFCWVSWDKKKSQNQPRLISQVFHSTSSLFLARMNSNVQVASSPRSPPVVVVIKSSTRENSECFTSCSEEWLNCITKKYQRTEIFRLFAFLDFVLVIAKGRRHVVRRLTRVFIIQFFLLISTDFPESPAHQLCRFFNLILTRFVLTFSAVSDCCW